MYSKATLAGHPIHPMLVAYPVAGYTGTLVGFAVYAANGQQFWLNFAIALNIAGVGGAVLAAVPGVIDLRFGIPKSSAALAVGRVHAGLNVAALALFSVTMAIYASHWDGPARSATLGLVLSAVGVACTVGAGFLGWMLVQNYHVGVQLSRMQEHEEAEVQSTRLIRLRHDRAA